jgi:hypothetical protein
MKLMSVLALATATIAQSPPSGPVPVTLPAPLRAHVKNETFQMVTSIRGLPLGVRDSLQTLFGSLDIAAPGAAFNGTGAAGGSHLPTRRLVTAGCSIDHCLVYYERGGTAHTWHAALFHWTPEATRVECGGIAPRGLASVDDVLKAILSGAIKRPANGW